ncbi:response regulator transcription factor [Streptomyces sp. NPDC058470]|uniref:response regulator transcription factor n=1 Tax=Streptomyces sp. NPDC058470 TaxID=3346515 RepID=UPI003661FE5A
MSGTRSDRVRVPIVDDEPGLTELLSVAVTEAGRRPSPAADGESALRAARGCAPHAAVPDGMLPDMTQPCSPEEGVLRLRGPLRRSGAHTHRSERPARILGDLMLSEDTREVHRDGRPVRLTAKEFDLLSLLLSHPRQVLSKARILYRVWNSPFDGDGNLVELYISCLRRKIDKGRTPMIHTVRGVGYAIRPAEESR